MLNPTIASLFYSLIILFNLNILYSLPTSALCEHSFSYVFRIFPKLDQLRRIHKKIGRVGKKI